MNLPLPTLGGKQFWTDLRIDRGWRIQRQAITGHFRLLDAKNRRRAWGSRATCDAAWERLGPSSEDPAERRGREVVVLLHGLGRTRRAMKPMAEHLRAAGYEAVDFGYASTRASIADNTAALAEVVSHLAGYQRLHFVGHSLGNLIVRRFLKDRPADVDPPAGRVVMLAPPNNGSALAVRLRANPVFMAALGSAGQEIAAWDELAKNLATPREFGVIAGDCTPLRNPLLDRAADLVVAVEETKLEGMADFLCLDVTHTFLMRNPEVMDQTLAFLRSGRFDGGTQRRRERRGAGGAADGDEVSS